MKIPKNLLPVAPIMARFPGKVVAQRDFLKKHGVKSAFCVPNRRGYSHYVTPDGAEKLEQILLSMMTTSAPEPELPAAPAAELQPETQSELPPEAVDALTLKQLPALVNTMCVSLDAMMRAITAMALDIRVLTEERADQVKKSDALTLQLGKTMHELGGAVSSMDGRVKRLAEALGETA